MRSTVAVNQEVSSYLAALTLCPTMSIRGSTLLAVIVTMFLSVDALRPVDENPCYRSCESSFSMTCVFDWTVTWYYAMAKDQCGECPTDQTACSNPGCVAVDGVPRAITTVNFAIPGPSIQICSGDTVVINVNNNMTNNEGLTIHWHGLFQNGTQLMDGLTMVTQCPIPSPGRFQYTFTPYDPGTYWYHSHTGLQRGDGLFGAFVIRESNRTDPNAGLYDEDLAEHVIFVNDWHHNLTVANYEKEKHGDSSPPVDSILINGKGIPIDGSAPFVPLEVFNVQQGTRYRFRVINGGNSFCNLQFSIEGHSLLVIAGDGSAFEPQAVNYFRFNSGERYDFVLNANQSIGNYKVQVVGLDSCGTKDDGSRVGRQIAHLHYDTAPEPTAPASLPNVTQEGDQDIYWKTFPNKSLAEINNNVDSGAIFMSTGGTPDAQYYIETSFQTRESPIPNQQPQGYPQLNNISFVFPFSPVNSQFNDSPPSLFCNESSFEPGECNGLYHCTCSHTINVPMNTLVEIVLVNPDSFYVLHPMHLHGLQYSVVAMERMEGATVESVKELDQNGGITRNLNGPMKDVVVVPNGGYTIFRFRAWNGGWWIFHCHIEFHLEDGMALMFKVGHSKDFQSPPLGFPKCGVFPNVSYAVEAEPQTAAAATLDTAHLGWIIPLTFLVALALGLLVGFFFRNTPRANGRRNVRYSAQSGAVDVQASETRT